MNQVKKLELIIEAQNYLINNPQDALHDITHHYRVWVNAQTIIKEEHLDNVNLDIIEIICWWHDVDNPNIPKDSNRRTAELTALYIANQFEEKESEIIFDSIKNHEFGSTPTYIEGKVLQDADKLELLSRDRVNWALENLKAGKISKDWLVTTAKGVKDNWFPKMLDKYNFQYSRQYHINQVDDFSKFLDEVILALG